MSVLAVLGGGHAIYSFFSADPVPPGDDSMVAVAGHAQLASSFAEDFVMTYLGGDSSDQDALARYIDGTQQISLPKTGQKVAEPIVVYQSRTLAGGAVEVWSVTVSVRIGTDGTRQHYRVPVSVSEGQLRALALPAAVEPPGIGPDLAQAYSAPCGEETAFTQVATGFLDAYLTGSGDVARYVTVGSAISALQPAPFRELATVAVTAEDTECGTGGSSARVLATVTPKGAGGAAPALAYPLTMVRGEGQWQVQAIDLMPALREPLSVVTRQGGDQSSSPGVGATTASPTTAAQIPPATQN